MKNILEDVFDTAEQIIEQSDYPKPTQYQALKLATEMCKLSSLRSIECYLSDINDTLIETATGELNKKMK